MFFEAVVSARPESLQIPKGFGDADYRNVQMTSLNHCLQSGKYLFVSEIAGGAKEYKRIRVLIFHIRLL